MSRAFGIVTITCAALLAGCSLVHRDRQTISAHYASPAAWALGVPPCTAKTIPRSGVCRGVGRSTTPATFTGDWEGRTEYTYGWLTLPSGVSHTLNLETFSGTVKGCGTGSMTYRMFGSCDPSGQCSFRWQTIDELGTGDLTGLRGRGTMTGVSRDDFSSAGDLQGWVRCPH